MLMPYGLTDAITIALVPLLMFLAIFTVQVFFIYLVVKQGRF